MSRIILASGSPRRRELLSQIGLKFTIIPSSKEEDMSGSDPAETVCRLAAVKARDIYDQQEEKSELLVIGADTVVVNEGHILGKPKDTNDAVNMLRSLQGKSHAVYTGVCLITEKREEIFYVKTDVKMRKMTEESILKYVLSGEPMDKAGSYAIQGLGAVFIQEIHGDYNNVVGLPVSEITARIMQFPDMEKIFEANKE